MLRRVTVAGARLLLWLAVLFGGAAAAQQELEIIPLRSQAVEQVLPTLLPLVEPGGTLTGMNDQLFLRASPRNREEIKRVLASIDRPARRLVIHVSRQRESEAASRGVVVDGQVVITDDGSRGRVDARLWDAQRAASENSVQMVRTVEGGQAYIQVGRSLPLPMRQVVAGPGGRPVVADGVVYRDVGSGFYASPRLNGDRVTIEISQQADSVSPHAHGGLETQRLTTKVAGRLGEWIELGGTRREAVGSAVGRGSAASGGSEASTVWLRVEEVK